MSQFGHPNCVIVATCLAHSIGIKNPGANLEF